MPKKPEKVTLEHNFAFTSDGDLATQIAAFKAEHEAAQQQILAMDNKRSLGPGKVRVTFRVIDKKRSKGR
jgi:hypothetical protein